MHCALIDLPQLASPTGSACRTPAPKVLPAKPLPRVIDRSTMLSWAPKGEAHARAIPLRRGAPHVETWAHQNSQGQLQRGRRPIIGAGKDQVSLSASWPCLACLRRRTTTRSTYHPHPFAGCLSPDATTALFLSACYTGTSQATCLFTSVSHPIMPSQPTRVTIPSRRPLA